MRFHKWLEKPSKDLYLHDTNKLFDFETSYDTYKPFLKAASLGYIGVYGTSYF